MTSTSDVSEISGKPAEGGALTSNDASPTEPGEQRAGVSSTVRPLSGSPRAGTAARTLALFTTLGGSLVLWAQLTFRSKWVTEYLIHNTLPAGRRELLLISLLAGAGFGALASVVALLVWTRVRHRPLAELERAAWFVTPLSLLPFLPVLFRYAAWKNLVLPLLLTTTAFILVLEGAVLRSLRACPERLAKSVQRARERLPRFVKLHAATLTVLAGAVYYTVFMSYWTIVRNHKLQAAVYDLGISDNLMYNALHGHFMVSPIFSGVHATPGSFMAGHAQLGVYVLLPFYAIHPCADTLLAIQSALLGLTALPLYSFARQRVGPWTSAFVALAFLAYFPMHGANFHDVTFIPIAAFFVVATVWAVDRGNWWCFLPALAAALSMREDIAIGLAVAGVVFLLAGKRPGMALTLTGVSVVYFLVIRFWVMPHEGKWFFPKLLYNGLIPSGAPKTFGSVAETIVTNPVFAFRQMLTEQKLKFVLDLLVPLAFLPLRRGWLWAAVIPGVILTLLTTNYGPTVETGFQYTMHWAPYLFLAAPLALAALRERAGARKMQAAVCAMLMASAVTTWNFGAFAEHPTFKAGFASFHFRYTAAQKHRYEQLMQVARQVPKGASLAVSETIGALVANRVEAYSMRNGVQGADYIMAGKNDLGQGARQSVRQALTSGRYGVIARVGEFALLKKGASTAGNLKLRTDWGL